MVQHWLGCPPCGYLGQDYGADAKALLHTPMAAGLADDLIDKCRQDIPLVGQLGAGGLNVYSYDQSMDRKAVVFEIAGQAVPLQGTR